MSSPDNTPAGIIKRILSERPGAANAITGRELRQRLINSGIRLGDRRMRTIIESDCPAVCFSDRGYFIPLAGPEGNAEVGRVLRRLHAYHQGLKEREDAILAAYPDARQGSLFGEVGT